MWSCDENLVKQTSTAFASDGMTFVNALTTMMAAHCAITNDSQWPLDRRDEVLAGELSDERGSGFLK